MLLLQLQVSPHKHDRLLITKIWRCISCPMREQCVQHSMNDICIQTSCDSAVAQSEVAGFYLQKQFLLGTSIFVKTENDTFQEQEAGPAAIACAVMGIQEAAANMG